MGSGAIVSRGMTLSDLRFALRRLRRHRSASITVGAMMSAALARLRFTTTLLGAFGLSALLLAAVGLASVLWFTTRERTREIGIRLALGASAGRTRLEVLREGAGLALGGLVLGAGSRPSWRGWCAGCCTRSVPTTCPPTPRWQACSASWR